MNNHIPAEGNPLANTIPPLYIPRRFMRLLQRLTRLEPGRYLLTVTLPEGEDAEPDHTVLPLGKVENKR